MRTPAGMWAMSSPMDRDAPVFAFWKGGEPPSGAARGAHLGGEA